MASVSDTQTTSSTVRAAREQLRPDESVRCATCPASLWFLEPDELKCFCRMMNVVAWETGKANQIVECDGPMLAMQDAG